MSGRVVVDASAMVEWLLRTGRGRALDAALRSHELHTPSLCDVEVAAALRRALLARRLDLPRVEQALIDYADLPLARHRHSALLPAILALRDSFSAYDACYAALAGRLDAGLVTADAAFGRAVTRHLTIAVLAT